MTTLPRVLVTGAAGKSGRPTVLTLTERYSDVVQTRAMVRRDDDRAAELRAAGAEVVIGDMSSIRDLRMAMKGVQRAHLIAPVTNSYLDHAVNCAVAAQEEGVEHVMAIGQWLASESHPSLMTRRTYLVDQLLGWIPEVDYTVINVGFFADNIMAGLGIAAQLGVLRLPLGHGATALVSNEDIGRVAAGVLSNPAPYAGRTLRPTGPKVLTIEDIAAVFSEVLGREVRYQEASERMALKSIRAGGKRAPFEQTQVVHYLREYRRGTFAAGETTNVVEEVTGRPAENFQTIVRRYAAADPLTRRSLSNLLRAVRQVAKVMLTRPLELKRWERENSLPIIDGQDSIDATEWKRTHVVPNAFGA